jgi:LuxR family maltose regulon positive regulatory protein
VVVFTLGEASWQTGDLAEAGRAFTEASRIDRTSGNFLAAVLELSEAAILLTEQGELHRAAENYRAAIQMVTRPDGRMLPAAAQACHGLSGLEYEWNDLEAASHHTEQAMELGRRWGNPDTMAGSHLMRARLQQAQGDTMGAFESLRQAEELRRGQSVTPVTMHSVDAFRMRLWLAQGNLEAVAGWAREQALDPHDEITYPYQVTYLTLARFLIAENQTETALFLLGRIMAQVEALGQMGRLLEVLMLQSLAFDREGDRASALAALARSMTIRQSEGYVRMFLDEGAPMAKLLRQAGSHGVAPKVVAGLLSQFDKEIGSNPASLQPLIEPLTGRELEVLRLLAEGLSNQEIADQLIVALGTIKTHTASLYRKLDVTSRTQAVRRAKELGLH